MPSRWLYLLWLSLLFLGLYNDYNDYNSYKRKAMENLGIDGKLLLAQLINFALFFFIFKKYIAGPFGKFLSQEKQNEKEKEALLAKLKKGEEELMQKELDTRDKVKKERLELLEKAKHEAAVLRDEMIVEAKKDAETVRRKAEKEKEEEKNKLYRDVKNKVADLSILIVEKALRDFLDEESRKRITTHILKNLSSTIVEHEN